MSLNRYVNKILHEQLYSETFEEILRKESEKARLSVCVDNALVGRLKELSVKYRIPTARIVELALSTYDYNNSKGDVTTDVMTANRLPYVEKMVYVKKYVLDLIDKYRDTNRSRFLNRLIRQHLNDVVEQLYSEYMNTTHFAFFLDVEVVEKIREIKREFGVPGERVIELAVLPLSQMKPDEVEKLIHDAVERFSRAQVLPFKTVIRNDVLEMLKKYSNGKMFESVILNELLHRHMDEIVRIVERERAVSKNFLFDHDVAQKLNELKVEYGIPTHRVIEAVVLHYVKTI